MKAARLLLREPAGAGYPIEYLVARLRARQGDGGLRRFLVAGNQAAPSGCYDDREIELAALRENRWLYTQMDSRTRGLLLPVFVYSELCRLFHLLRQREGNLEPIEAVLNENLLHADMIAAFRQKRHNLDFIKFLDRVLAGYLPESGLLAKRYGEAGLAGAEKTLIEAMLGWGTGPAWPPIVRENFSRLADRYNMRKLFKWRRWGLAIPCSFAQGGRLSRRRLRRVLQSGNYSVLDHYRAGDTGDDALIDSGFARQLRASLTRQARLQEPLAVILLYLFHLECQQVELRQEALRHFYAQKTAATEAGA